MSQKETLEGKFYAGNRSNNILMPEDQLSVLFEKNRLAKEQEEAAKLHLEALQNKQKEIEEKLATLELMPMLNKVILMEYPENPYTELIRNGVIVGYDGSFQNPDSGTPDKLTKLVSCAKVIEVGPEVKYLKAGDDVFYDTRTCYPVPFMRLGYILTSEPQILCALNSKLKERFNM